MAGNPLDSINTTLSLPGVSGGSNPLDMLGSALPLGGGTAAPDNPVTSAQQGVNKYLDMIAGSGDAGAVRQAQSAGKGHSNWLSDALKVLDYPRAAVLSTGRQVEHAMYGGNVSANQWLSDIQNHTSTSDVMRSAEKGGGIGKLVAEAAGQGALATPVVGLGGISGLEDVASRVGTGKWMPAQQLANTAGGTLGDIAEDPLSYLGGGGEAAKAAGIAGRIAEGVSAAGKADRLAKAAEDARTVAEAAKAAGTQGEGLDALTGAHRAAQADAEAAAAEAATKTANGVITPDTMARIQTKGVAGLTAEERSALEGMMNGTKVSTGITARVPGTKLIGKEKSFTVVPGKITDPVMKAIAGTKAKIADTQMMNGLEDKFVPLGSIKSQIRAAAMEGDGERAAALTNILRAAPQAAGVARKTVGEFGPQFAEALKQIPDSALSHVAGALEGDPYAVSAIEDAGGTEGVDNLRQVYQALHKRASDEGVQLGTIENYFPHQLTDAAKQATQKAGSVKAARKAFEGELRRQYGAGDQFLGHTLEHGTVAEMNSIARDVHGTDAYDLFKTDPREVTSQYLRGMARRIGEQHFANKLDELGVTASGDMARSPADWAALAASGAHAKQAGPEYVKDALEKLKESTSHGKTPPAVLHYYDQMLNLWKKYELAMPGKAIRHTMAGPAWGMWIAGVSKGNAGEAFKAWRTFQHSGIDAVKDPQLRHEIEEFTNHGVAHGHEFDMSKISGKGKPNWNPLSNRFQYFDKNQRMQAGAQDYSRFAMFHDAIKKGALPADAAKKTRMFLGDPHNITAFERSTARRLVPFYTFLRQNMPTELRQMLVDPGKFEAFQHASQNITGDTKKPSLVPQLFKDTMAIELPFDFNGSQGFVSPDLPFTRMGELASGPHQWLAQMSPVVKLPLELEQNTPLYSGVPFSPYAGQAPNYGNIPVLSAIMDKLGLEQKVAKSYNDYGTQYNKGEQLMTPKMEYAIESLLPMLGQARRAVPNQPNYKSRQTSTDLAYLLGQNFRTDDPTQQAGVLYQKQAALKAIIEKLQSTGELPRFIYGFHS